MNDNTGRFDNLQGVQLKNLIEDFERMSYRPACSVQHTMLDNRENINFKNYRRNPVEFLERVDECLLRTKENRWTMIKNLLDDSFKEITDNWWSAVRNEITTYEEFKQTFRIKYWSESVQNIIRDNLCHGRYNATHYQSPTAYFLGKVCVACNLEPKIPEECLISKMAHH